MRIDLNEEHLVSTAAAKQSREDIYSALSQQFMDVNMILHTSDLWINQVRSDKAHDPSMYVSSNTVSIENNKVSATGQVVKTEEESIEHMKKYGQWAEHQLQCEKRFEAAQNWTRLMSLVQIYESWDGDYRHKLFSQIDMTHPDIENKIAKPQLCNTRFGNMRHIRNKFLHNRGVFADDVPDELFEEMVGLFEKDKPMLLPAVSHNLYREAILDDIYSYPVNFFLIGKPKDA